MPVAFVAWGWISPWGAFPGRLRSVAPSHIRRAPAHVLMAFAWLSVQCGGVRVLSSISSPYSDTHRLMKINYKSRLYFYTSKSYPPVTSRDPDGSRARAET